MLKLKMMLCDDVAAGRRRLYIKAACRQCVSNLLLPPAWIMQPPPDWQTAERDYFHPRERLITMQKTTGRNPGILMSRCRWSASASRATHAIIVST